MERGARSSDKAAAAAGGAQDRRGKDGEEDGELASGSSWLSVRA